MPSVSGGAKHTDDPRCPWRAALRALGGKWKGLILWRLSEASRRFGELKRLVDGITDKMLAEQLRELEADGLISRRDFRAVPPRVLYSLTEYGETALPAIFAMTRWGRVHLARTPAEE